MPFLWSSDSQHYVRNIIAEQIFGSNWIGLNNRLLNRNLIRVKMCVCGGMGESCICTGMAHIIENFKVKGKFICKHYSECIVKRNSETRR